MNIHTPQTVEGKTRLERCPPIMPNKGCAKQGVCRTVALPFTLKGILQQTKNYGLAIYIKRYLTAKEELWKLKYFTIQKYNLQNIL
jgi:hypothetical protein